MLGLYLNQDEAIHEGVVSCYTPPLKVTILLMTGSLFGRKSILDNKWACLSGASKGVIVWEWVNPFPHNDTF